MALQAVNFFESSFERQAYSDDSRGMSTRQRRSLRGPSANQRLTNARNAQSSSGVRVRIARSVVNQTDFQPELKAWIPSVQDGVASRKSLGNLAMTVFDTTQQPLRFSDDLTEESLTKDFQRRYPLLFVKTKPLEVTGIALFGNRDRPFIGLTFAPGQAFDEIGTVRDIVAPELALDASHQQSHQPHVSLGQAFSYDRAVEIMAKLDPVRPDYVQFAPATVLVETNR